MFRNIIFVVAGLIVLFLIVGTGHSSVMAHDEAVHIEMHDDKYVPNEVEIEAGTTVEFTNVGQKDHWPASNIHPTHEIYSEFDPQQPIPPGESWSFTFDKAGEWKMHDHIYPGITGSISVNGDTESPESSEPNWFVRLWRSITSWFASIGLSEDTDIFNDESKLQPYVAKYGIEKTAQKLYELAESNEMCHDTAHRAGRYAYEEFGNKVFSSHAPECNSGTIHGATEAFFAKNGTANLEESIATICDEQLDMYYSHECLHGVGHGLMAWSSYEIHEALEICESLEKGSASCYSGIFMENVVGGLSGYSGHTTEYLSEDPHVPCSVIEQKYRDACYFYQTTRMLELFDGNLQKIAEECDSPQAKPYGFSCFGSLGRDAGNVLGVQEVIDFCQNLKTKDTLIGSCLMGAADLSFVTVDQKDEAVEFCTSVKQKYSDDCFNLVFQRVPAFIEQQSERKEFCQSMPQDFISQCETATT